VATALCIGLSAVLTRLSAKAIGDVYRRLGEEWWRGEKSTDVGTNMASAFVSFAEGGALDFTVDTQSKDAYQIDVTRCQYAEFYNELGEPELGFLLVCSLDFPFADGFGSSRQAGAYTDHHARRQHCDFRYERRIADFLVGSPSQSHIEIVETLAHHARSGVSADRAAISASASNNRYYKNHV
jgi:predicted nucleic-acid-binding Zn-ribbon protein